MGRIILRKLVLCILRGLAYGYWFLPRRIQLVYGAALGWFLYQMGFRKKVIYENLARAFPEQEAECERIARASYIHLGNLVFEILLLLGPMKKFIFKYIDLTGLEHLEAARKQGKGVIFLASHVGNWEVMAGSGGLIAKSDLMLVTKQLKPDWIHQAIEEGRKKCDVSATYEPRTLRDILTHLKNNGTVGIVLDQYAGPPIGVRVPLFGVPVGTSFAVATLVKRTGAILLPVDNHRKSDGRWAVAVRPPLAWKEYSDPHYELAANTAAYTSVIEKDILSHPEQWLWMHRRFKGDLSPLRHNEWKEPRIRQ